MGCQGHYNSSKRRRESHTLTLQLLSANDTCHFCLTGLAKASHMAPALWEGPEVPFLPCQAELGTLQWAAPTTAIPVQTSIFPCFLEPFLPAPSHSLIELVQLVPKPLACIANIALPSCGFVKWMRVSVSSWPVRTSRTCRLIHSSEHSAQHIRCLINEVFME